MLIKPSPVKKGGYACQWLRDVDMHVYAKFDQNILCGAIVMSILLTDHRRTDSQSDYRVVDADFALVVNLNSKCHIYDLDRVLFSNCSPLYNLFLFLNQNICCGYSKEPSR